MFETFKLKRSYYVLLLYMRVRPTSKKKKKNSKNLYFAHIRFTATLTQLTGMNVHTMCYDCIIKF